MRNRKDAMKVKVRFAPSPTGLLHVGNIKVAIMNYLFARKHGGTFVLRIDDTDIERSTVESEKSIFEDLAWLGVMHDELYKQSENIDRYIQTFEDLKNAGRVYPCYETREELALQKKVRGMQGLPPVYDRSAFKLTDAERKSRELAGTKPYWRFRLNESNSAEWNDLVHGKISVPLSTISDPVLVKPDGSFVYTLASVVDDINLGITHVIRGDDHITNTAVQIELFKAISGTAPEFAHLPLFLSIDGQEVSKRTGSNLSIVNMRKRGIFPHSLWVVLSTLGTSNNADHHDNMESMISKFDFQKMSASPPKFNIEDINFINKKIISEMSFDEARDHLQKIGLQDASEYFWETIRGNINVIYDAISWYEILCGNLPGMAASVDPEFAKQMLESLPDPFDFDEWISSLKKSSGKKGRDLFHPIRIVLTGTDNGPELKRIANILGYTKIKERVYRFFNGPLTKNYEK